MAKANAATRIDPSEYDDRNSSRKRRGKKRWALATFAGVLLMVLFAPTIIAHTALRDKLLGMAVSESQGSIHAQGASLGWFSPIEVRGIEVFDADGELLLSAPSIATEKPLLAILRDAPSLGTVRIEQPEVQVRLLKDSSNVEQFVAPWTNSPDDDDAAQPLPDLVVEINDATVKVVDQTIGRKWRLQDVAVNVALQSDPSKAVEVTASATTATGARPSSLSVELQLSGPAAATYSAGRIQVKAETWPLQMVQSLLERYRPGCKILGDLNAQLEGTWAVEHDSPAAALSGKVEIVRLTAADSMLGSDQVRMKQLSVPASLSIKGNQLNVEALQVACDAGSVKVQGTLDLENLVAETMALALAKETYSIEGEFDLARVAALLPDTLQIRGDTKITGGTAEFALKSLRDDDVHRWQGGLSTRGLTAASGQRQLAWEQPIHAVWNLHAADDGLAVDQLDCKSEFLQISASGRQNQVRGTAQFDLDRLVKQLGQFIDTSQWRLAGIGQGEFGLSAAEAGKFQAGMQLGITKLQLAAPGLPTIVEDAMNLEAAASGAWSEQGLSQVDDASFTLTTEHDWLSLSLAAPVQPESYAAKGIPINLQIRGRLEQWKPRLAHWIPASQLETKGRAELSANVVVAPQQINIEKATFKLKRLQVNHPGLRIDNPAVYLTVRGGWNRAAERLTLRKATLDTAGILVRSEDLVVQPFAAGLPSVTGKFTATGRLSELANLVNPAQDTTAPAASDDWDVQGKFDVTAQILHSGGKTAAQMIGQIESLSVAQWKTGAQGRKRQVLWQEPTVALAAQASYEGQADQLDVTEAQLTSQLLKLAATGQVQRLSHLAEANFSGTAQYDLEKVTPLLASYLGEDVLLAGRKEARFKIHGPLIPQPAADGTTPAWSRRLAGELQVEWDRAEILGLAIGKGTLETRLADGGLLTTPFDIRVSEGRLTSAPAVRLDPEPFELFLPKGPMLTNVRLTPDICDRMLKYVAPVLAEATEADGLFSVDLDGGRVPLTTPETGDVAGRLNIHQVKVAPGALAKDYILLSRQVEAIIKRRPPPVSLGSEEISLLTLANQKVDFRMVGGRVHHQNLTFQIGDVVVHSSGSVGLDQTLDLVATVPIQDAWVSRDPVLRNLSGQTVQLRIGGTLNRPRIDRRSLEQLAGQFVRGAAEQALRNEVGKQLNRLLKPR